MAQQLQLVHRRRTKLRVSIEMIAMPLMGLLVLIQVESLRSPLSESEAPYALAVRQSGTPVAEQTSPTATIAASLGPTLIKPNEFGMRAFGVVVGCASLGVLAWLGARLFSVRTGVIAGVILIATPLGRSFLGTQFGVEPFYLLLFLGALSATRNLAIDKRSLTRANLLGGTAVALVGPMGLWIPVMTLAWLRKLHGLGWRTCALTIGTSLGSAALISSLAALAVGAPLAVSIQIPPFSETLQSFLVGLVEIVPFLPIVILGLINAPRHWRYHGSPRFLFLWAGLAGATFFIFGSISALWVAAAMGGAVAINWALARAEPTYRWGTIAAGVALGIGIGAFAPSQTSLDVDRWAVREAGKFVKRNLSADAAIAAPTAARGRLAYYGSRPVAALASPSGELNGLDYILLNRATMPAPPAGLDTSPYPPREIEFHGHRLYVVAEFGSWMLARVEAA